MGVVQAEEVAEFMARDVARGEGRGAHEADVVVSRTPGIHAVRAPSIRQQHDVDHGRLVAFDESVSELPDGNVVTIIGLTLIRAVVDWCGLIIIGHIREDHVHVHDVGAGEVDARWIVHAVDEFKTRIECGFIGQPIIAILVLVDEEIHCERPRGSRNFTIQSGIGILRGDLMPILLLVARLHLLHPLIVGLDPQTAGKGRDDENQRKENRCSAHVHNSGSRWFNPSELQSDDTRFSGSSARVRWMDGVSLRPRR